MLTLCSELALLLVATGESEILAGLLLLTPDLTLYREDVGMLVMRGRKLLGVLRRISMCLKAISKDFFERVRPKPVLSGDDAGFTGRLECMVDVDDLVDN